MEQAKILIVDDESTNLDLLANILKQEYKIRALKDPKMALELLESEYRPDLILLDIIMPGIDGYEVCEKIKSNSKTKDIPVIFISANNDIESETHGFEVGGADYVTKPFNPLIVKARIHTHLVLSDTNKELQKRVLQQQEKLEKAFLTDHLTELENTLALSKELNVEGEKVLYLISINRMYEINEYYGSEVGDMVLVQFAKKLIDIFEELDVKVYRTHGNTFGVYGDNLMQFHAIEQKIQELLHFVLVHTFEIRYKQNIYNLPLQVAVGFEQGQYKTYAYASMALHEAKSTNQPLVKFSSALHLTNNVQLTVEIHKAIEENRVVPFFQPIVNNATGEIEKYETLMRIVKPDGTIQSPFHFLDTAKGARLYPLMTLIMQKRACDIFTHREEQFSINIGKDDIYDVKTREYILNNLKQVCNPEQIIFELVESEDLNDSQTAFDFISKLKEIGCQIAIDDFGSGYSNFEYLLQIQADIIKIDGSLIKDIDKSSEKRAIVKSIVGFAKDMGIETVAEFVSHKEIYEVVKEMGITYSQGYYFGKPQTYFYDL